jgi:hypothetical protein
MFGKKDDPENSPPNLIMRRDDGKTSLSRYFSVPGFRIPGLLNLAEDDL